MSKATYDSTVPVSGSNFSSSNIRNNFQSLSQGDSNPLRPRAQASPNMTVAVGNALTESYYQRVYNDNAEPLVYAGGNSPTVIAPAGNNRIDVLHISGTTTGTLHWTVGTEGASPSMPPIPSGSLPVCAVYLKTTSDRILDYEDKDNDSTEGYIYRDLRPRIVRPTTDFLSLNDTPPSYSGEATKYVKVSHDATALEFVDTGEGNLIIPLPAYTDDIQGTWATAGSDGWGGANINNDASNAVDDELQFLKYLGAGDYKCVLFYTESTDKGIAHVSFDTVEKFTIDMYAGSAANVWARTSSFNIPTSGLKDIRIKIASKHASSTNHIMEATTLIFERQS